MSRLAITLGGVLLITLANAASPIKSATLRLPVASFDGKTSHYHLVAAGVAETNQLCAIGRDQEVVGAVDEGGERHFSRGVMEDRLPPVPLVWVKAHRKAT